jgi:hypothetical protein
MLRCGGWSAACVPIYTDAKQAEHRIDSIHAFSSMCVFMCAAGVSHVYPVYTDAKQAQHRVDSVLVVTFRERHIQFTSSVGGTSPLLPTVSRLIQVLTVQIVGRFKSLPICV